MLLLSSHLSARKERRSLFKLPQKAPNQGMGEAASGMDGEHSRTVHTDGSSRDLPRSCPLLGLWEEELSCVHRWGRPQFQFPALPLAPPCCWQSSPGAENSIAWSSLTFMLTAMSQGLPPKVSSFILREMLASL